MLIVIISQQYKYQNQFDACYCPMAQFMIGSTILCQSVMYALHQLWVVEQWQVDNIVKLIFC